MRQISHDYLKKVLYSAYSTKTPLYVHGAVGIGKSQTIKAVAQEIAQANNFKFLDGGFGGKQTFGFIDVRLSQMDPSDLRGLPNFEGETTKWYPPNWLPKDKEGCGILFFDELSNALPSMMASAYQIILDRKLGDYQLPEGWVIVSAGNRIEDKANIYEMPSPLANRFVHVELGIPTRQEWQNWAFENKIEPSIIAFLEFKPSFLFKFDSKSKEKAFPTPRSWSYVNKLIKGTEEDEDLQEILVSSAVGEGVGIEFMAFLRLKKKINIKEILEKPEMVREIEEISLKYSLMSGLTEKYKEDKKNLQKIVRVCLNLEPEFAILLLRFMKNVNENMPRELLTIPESRTLGMKYGKYLNTERIEQK